MCSPFEREGCQTADPGCTPAAQLAGGGIVDAVLSTVGLFLLVAAGFFLAAAARKVDGWTGWAWPIRWATIVILVLILATGFLGVFDIGGLLERLLALAGAAGIAALAVGVLRQTRPEPAVPATDSNAV
jgi:cytochrome c oxidase subunit IV